jgi:hypothetical protein
MARDNLPDWRIALFQSLQELEEDDEGKPLTIV